MLKGRFSRSCGYGQPQEFLKIWDAESSRKSRLTSRFGRELQKFNFKYQNFRIQKPDDLRAVLAHTYERLSFLVATYLKNRSGLEVSDRLVVPLLMAARRVVCSLECLSDRVDLKALTTSILVSIFAWWTSLMVSISLGENPHWKCLELSVLKLRLNTDLKQFLDWVSGFNHTHTHLIS